MARRTNKLFLRTTTNVAKTVAAAAAATAYPAAMLTVQPTGRAHHQHITARRNCQFVPQKGELTAKFGPGSTSNAPNCCVEQKATSSINACSVRVLERLSPSCMA
eukprot:3169-Heterococcus_DN1.PRE.2